MPFHPLPPTQPKLEVVTLKDEIISLIRQTSPSSDAHFNDLAVRLFQDQFEKNIPYQRFCLNQKKGREGVRSWKEIPCFPVTGFKYADITCRPITEAIRIFQSSGTTSEKRSRHPLFDIEPSRTTLLTHFSRHLLPEGMPIRMMILTHSPDEAPESSLSYMMESVRTALGERQSRYYVHQNQLQCGVLAGDLSSSEGPVCLLGTSFSFVHFLDFLQEQEISLSLPAGSRLMDTGGLKGQAREVSRERLVRLYQERLGLPFENCVNEYGMTEMTSQFYDTVVGRGGIRGYHVPPQVRTRVLHPKTLVPVSQGEIGLLAHIDLANIDSVAAILTEDTGYELEDHRFIFSGRASGSEARGCSLTALNLH